MTSINLIRCAAVLLAAVTGGNVLAGGSPAEPSKTITHSDLNLSSAAGVAVLYQRIERAAEEVCQLPMGTKMLRLEVEIKACRADAADRAITQANLPALSALHLARTGRKPHASQYADRR